MSQDNPTIDVAPFEHRPELAVDTPGSAAEGASGTLNVDIAPLQADQTQTDQAAPTAQTALSQSAGSDAFGPSGLGDAAVGLGEPEMDTPRVLVIGVGGAGGNAVNTMIRRELAGVDYLAANTDAQALKGSLAPARLQLGRELTRGHGAGGKPEVGRKSAEESAEAIRQALNGAHMCFIAAGMGGGTGTGAAPAIATIARDLGVLTVGVVSKPFDFEGPRRRRLAEDGVSALAEAVDTIIIIPNQNLFRVTSANTTFTEAFMMANEILYQGVKGVTDLMFKPGLVNLDFSDVRAVMGGMGSAMMGSGEGEGENRATLAAGQAVDNPLLDDVSLRGARGVLINITGGPDMTLLDVETAASRVRQDADPDADIFFGSTIEPEMEGRVRVSVVATGVQRHATAPVESAPAAAPQPATPQPASAAESAAPQQPAAPTVAREEAVRQEAVRQEAVREEAVREEAVGERASRSDSPEPSSPRAKIGEASRDRPRFSPSFRPEPPLHQESEEKAAEPKRRETAAPVEPPVAGSSELGSDDLVRRIRQTMGPETGAPAAAAGDCAEKERPRSLGGSRPARSASKIDIPIFLRRKPT